MKETTNCRAPSPDRAVGAESVLAAAPSAAPTATQNDAARATLHNWIEIWVNEGGAGSDDDESPSRPRSGR